MTEAFYTFASDTSTNILIGITLYYEDDGWIAELYDTKAAFFHPNMEVKMNSKRPEVIVDLKFISEEFLKEYFILLGNWMYGNFDAALVWIRLLDKY